MNDPEVQLIAGAAITSKRCELGLRAMDHGKDYFTDKAPFTTLEQLELAKQKVKETGKKYMVYYSERLHVESAVFAGQLIEEGAIGRVIQVTGFGPHRLNAPSRPEWFFKKKSSMEVFFATSAAIKSSNFYTMLTARTQKSCTARWQTTMLRITQNLKTTVMPRSSAIMERQTIFV